MARRWRTEKNTHSNLYHVLIGTSGCGKDNPQKRIKGIISQVSRARPDSLGCKLAVRGLFEHIASGPALEDHLCGLKNQAAISNTDEIHSLFKAIALEQGATQNGVLGGIIMRLFTASHDLAYVRRIKQVEKGKKSDGYEMTMPYPSFTLCGSSTPEIFYDTLNKIIISSGLYGRMLIVDNKCTGINNIDNVDPLRPVPKSIIEEFCYIFGRLELDKYNLPIFKNIGYSYEGKRLYRNMFNRNRDLVDSYKRTDPARSNLIVRKMEITDKYAMIYAMCEDSRCPIITEQGLLWADEIISVIHGNMHDSIKNRISDNDHEGKKNIIKKAIAEAKDGFANKTYLCRKLRKIDKRTRDSITEELVEAKEIRAHVKIINGKPKNGFSVIDNN